MAQPICPRQHSITALYYRRPYRTSPDTILSCRACDAENALDRQMNPEPSDLYEEA